ncbi:hypothetical protein OYC64_001443 [Pagothenia borchgrevinki]|uniref:5-hydroxytryptamine receptor 3A-like n=1 Tax=Pagothenia borchgrevinki TaxID=8213 RepID=A0ABD2GB78_PAGBO
MSVQGILDVREIDQTLVSYIWIYMKWRDPDIHWDPGDFCGIEVVKVPADLLWKPDVIIEEMREKDKAHQSPNVALHSNGYVQDVNYLTVVSTCKMQVFKFPFDVQNCSLSFKSIIYTDEEITFKGIHNDTVLTNWSHEDMGTQYEWLFLNLTVNTTTLTTPYGLNQSRIVYTITMRRRSALYIANFLVPILFFFCLDLASFLISDSGGEKLSFKVTVLLAVTVMQLILNDILPSSSDRIPLIAVFCIGMFGLMMISLLETMLVMYLIDRDSASEENQADTGLNVKKWTHCACVCNVSDEPPSELLSVTKEDKRSQLMEESNSLEKLPEEMSEAVKALSLLLSRKEERKPDYWTRVAKKLDIIFFFVYVTVSALFLVVIFSLWIHAKDK